MKRGEMELRHPASAGLPRLRVDEPSLLFYPRPVAHEFRNPPREGSDFTCAELEFDGGPLNPLVRALPPLVLLPLARVAGLEMSLQLLFAETERVRCGQRVLADRLFEVVLIQLLRWLIDHPAEAGVQPGLVTGLSDPRIALALAAVREAPGEAWSLERMAARAGMSRSAFAARFRGRWGRRRRRTSPIGGLSLAQEQLRLGRSIKQIADQARLRERFGAVARLHAAGGAIAAGMAAGDCGAGRVERFFLRLASPADGGAWALG